MSSEKNNGLETQTKKWVSVSKGAEETTREAEPFPVGGGPDLKDSGISRVSRRS